MLFRTNSLSIRSLTNDGDIPILNYRFYDEHDRLTAKRKHSMTSYPVVIWRRWLSITMCDLMNVGPPVREIFKEYHCAANVDDNTSGNAAGVAFS